MAELFQSGAIVDFILLLVVAEAAALILLHRRSGRGLAPADAIAMLVPGALLLLALRTALTGGAWTWTALLLAASFAAHLADLAARWRKAGRPQRNQGHEGG